MKKNYFFQLFLLLISFNLFAQLPVSHTAENKNAVLEEFTGMHCTYCPDGHKIANQIHAAHPDDVVLINIHTGGYATPGSGEPDFRTSFGAALAGQSGLTGYPSGTVNRRVFSGNATAMGRGAWSSAVNQILGQNSYCNVALEGTIDVQTRELTVNVEVYYTGNSPANTNYLNVVLLQDNVEGPQTGASTFYPEMILPNGNYNHMHMLRHMLTGQWGEAINTTNTGTLIQRQYTYTIPNDINDVRMYLGNLHIAAFVTESHQEIVSGSTGPIVLTNYNYTNNVRLDNITNNVIYDNEICSATQLRPILKVLNEGSNVINSITLSYNVNNGTNQTYTWSGSILPFTPKEIELPYFSFPVENTNMLNISVTSVNGTNDENNADSTFSANDIIKTQNFGQDSNLVVTIKQDQYGSETTWKIKDDNDNVVASGGPYSNLTSAGTLNHVHNVNLPYGCYKFEINDAYGDGICCAYGAGNYKIETSSSDLVLQGSGDFGSKTSKPFRTSQYSLAVENNTFENIEIFPNPNQGNITIQSNKAYSFYLTDVVGRKILQNQTVLDVVNLDLTKLNNGVYYINFTDGTQKITKKIILNK